MDTIAPCLTEPGVKYFLSGTLKECRKFKDRHISIFFNIGMIILFVFVVGGFMIFKYKGKLTGAEIAQKNRVKQEYIVSKLQQLALYKQNQSESLITNLPTWDNHPETAILQRKIYR